MGFLVALGLVFAASVDAGGHESHKSKYIKWDPLIGAYTITFTQVFGQDVQVYGSLVFNAGGTFVSQTTDALGQSVPGGNPCGSRTTVSTGTWKKIGCRTYKLFSTDVETELGFPGDGAPECCCPATPTLRTKVESTLTLSKDGRFITSNDTMLSLWNLNDLSLNSDNIVPPFAIGPLIGERVGD